MSAATLDTRTQANQVRTALAWIDDNADWLPSGWHITEDGEVTWAKPDTHTLATLTHHLNPGTQWLDHIRWPHEGSRPTVAIRWEAS